MDDRQIVDLYLRRDETALRHTEETYGKYCLAVASGILCNRQDAEECVNDAYLSLWNSIPPAQPTSLKLYLTRIVRNLSFNRYKEQRRQKRGGGEVPLALEELDNVLADTSSVGDGIARDELVASINRFLYGLPARDANIFIKRYFSFFSTREIARTYGLKESHVLVILSRTREKLRQHLQGEGYVV